jgi:hypothetical protein
MTYIIWHILYDIYYILYDMSGCHNKWMLSFDVLIIRFIRSSSWILRWCTSWIDWKIGSKLKPMNEFGKPQRWRPRMPCLGTAMGSSKPPIDFRHLWVCCRTDVLAFCPLYWKMRPIDLSCSGRNHQASLFEEMPCDGWKGYSVLHSRCLLVLNFTLAPELKVRGKNKKHHQISSISLLVGGLEHFFIFPFSWECHNPNWFSYFSEGWLNHQPD